MRDRSLLIAAMLGSFMVLLGIDASTSAQIRIPADAPQPLAPADSAAAVSLPDGFSLQLVAAEPVIRNPSGVCWDERGRLFVCELHGYNMEGQYDVEELNKTGQLDRVVRRIPAPQEAIERAEQDQTGTVKRLLDTNGDGVMDKAEIWADDVPACFGIVAARGGVVVVCSPHIIYLADRDDDGVAEIRETLFTGFRMGVLERRMSAPQWGPDDWVYVAGGGGTITGPNLDSPVDLPRNDFRFKVDGTAIEPLPVGTSTFGFTFSRTGDRYVISTGSPAIYEAPLPWRYLRRNPHVGFGGLSIDVGPGQETYPTSQPHPWRRRRAADPGFEELYRTRYGAAESTPNGFFTSACSPLAYQDSALPLVGDLLACEPAQNMVHRSRIIREGLIPQLQRLPSEQRSEFLASTDIWFHPIAMSHAPDGAIVISDFYREIIEDYSAIPRYLQQQYQLKHGEHHGRLWRLVHRDMPPAASPDMSHFSVAELVAELSSRRFWRRQTARRLLIERPDADAARLLRKLVTKQAESDFLIAALHVLAALDQLGAAELNRALQHSDPAVVVQALRLADRRLDNPMLLDQLLTMVNASDERVQLQLAMSLGESNDRRAVQSLAMLAVQAIDVRWMDSAILSSLCEGGPEVLRSIIRYMDSEQPAEPASRFLARLTQMLAESRDDNAVSDALVAVLTESHNAGLQRACLAGLEHGFAQRRMVRLTEAGQHALHSALRHDDEQIVAAAKYLIVAMKVETAQQRSRRIQATAELVADVRLPVERRVAAVDELAAENDDASIGFLLASFNGSTPAVRAAIIAAVLARKESRALVLEAIASQQLPPSALSAVQREMLLNDADQETASTAAKLLAAADADVLDVAAVSRYQAALAGPRNPGNGRAVFQKRCSHCHRVGQLGFAVGPDLLAEFSRSEETFIQDILAPTTKITAGYETYLVQTIDGQIVTGLMSAESPTSVTLQREEGRSQTILRKDIEAIRVSEASLMPDDLVKSLTPQDVADLIAWLRGTE